jgi:hypothetical protein
MEIAAQTGCPVIDVYAATSGMPQNFPDNIHPNLGGCKAMAQAVFEAISNPPPPPGKKGDVDGNDVVNILDALKTAQYYVGLNPEGFLPEYADVTCDNKIGIIDALRIAQFYVGLITEFPDCKPPALTPTPPPPLTPSPPPFTEGTLELQAEKDAVWDDAAVESAHQGYTGSGYVNTANSAGRWIEWRFNLSSASEADCIFRYACGSDGRPMDLSVNGSVVSNLGFPATGSWSTWSTEKATVTLKAGSNTIRLTATGSNGAGNIDKVDIVIGG